MTYCDDVPQGPPELALGHWYWDEGRKYEWDGKAWIDVTRFSRTAPGRGELLRKQGVLLPEDVKSAMRFKGSYKDWYESL